MFSAKSVDPGDVGIVQEEGGRRLVLSPDSQVRNFLQVGSHITKILVYPRRESPNLWTDFFSLFTGEKT